MEENIQMKMEHTNAQLTEKILCRVPEQGIFLTDIDGLMLSRRDETECMESCFYRPTVGVVVQGFKRSMIGNKEYRYGKGHCMVSGVDMPSVNHIMDASPENPFLAVSIKLDRYLVTQLVVEVPSVGKASNGICRGVAVAEVMPEVLDAFLRLVELLDNPERIPVLAPMIIREIHYHLLTGPQGACLRTVSTAGTQSNQIAQAISWLRGNYKESLHIGALAKLVNMAESTFHRHFRNVTTLSPLQFQKRLRLYEAQRLMLSEDKDGTTAALEVGYESPTQFNREYKRQFGEPPYRDVSHMRVLGSVAGLYAFCKGNK